MTQSGRRKSYGKTMKNALLLVAAILLASLLSGFNAQASDEATVVEEAVEVDELGETETPDTLSIDNESVPTADDELQQQVQEAIAFFDSVLRFWYAIKIPIIFLFGYVLPAFFILRDRRVKLTERVLWLLATLAISWLAFLVFLWVAPLLGRRSEYEGEESSIFKTLRNILTGGISIGAGIAFGAGALLVMFATLMADASQGFAFFAGIPLIAGMVLMIPGVVLAVTLAIKGLRKSAETIVGPKRQGVAPAVITLAIGVMVIVIPASFRSFRNDPVLRHFMEISAFIGFCMVAGALGYLFIQLISGALKRRRQQR